MIFQKILPVVFGIWFAAGCGIANREIREPVDLTTREILALYPAENTAMQRLLNQTLLARGTKTLTDICEMLGDTASVIHTGAEYAIAAMVLNAEADQYGRIEKAITNALKSLLRVEDKRFLLEQLRYCGSDAAAGAIAASMDNQLLSETAVQTLCAIGTTGCAEILMEHYNAAPVSLKISILKNLGRMQYEPAAPEILKIAGESEGELRTAALETLADLDYPPAAEILRSNMDTASDENKDRAATLYLNFLEKTGQTGLRLEESRKIMTDPTFPGHVRLHAVRLGLETAGSRIL